MTEFIGQKQEELLLWLKGTLLAKGPNVCAIEGFSGAGKSWVALGLMAQMPPNFKYVKIDYPEEAVDQLDTFLLDMAEKFQEAGFPQVADAVDKGTDYLGLLTQVIAILHQPVLLVVDEFQLALEPTASHIRQPISRWLYNLSQSQLPGRVLLLSNVRLQRVKTTNAFAFQYLPELTPAEAEELLKIFLAQIGQQGEVPEDRWRDVVQALGCNPEALQVLASCLTYEPLEDLIGAMPDIWDVKDREVSPELLHRLKTILMARTLDHLESTALETLELLSVYRKPVKREAFRELAAGDDPALREALGRHFLLRQHRGWFSPHPVVREVVKCRLEGPRRQQYHTFAANYYTRHFHARQIVGGGALGGQFAEARYHLSLVGRLEELKAITATYVNHLKSIFHSGSPVPQNKEDLDGHIAMLQGLLEKAGAKGLEYYLARCLLKRNQAGDRKTALSHLRSATGREAPVDTWLLCITLEAELDGTEVALSTLNKALKNVSPEDNVFSIYCKGSELLSDANRLDEAIDLLREGIGKIPPDKNLHALYIMASAILTKCGRSEEALLWLRQGWLSIPIGRFNRSALFRAAIYILAAERDLESIQNLLRDKEPDLIEPLAVALCQVMQLQLQDDWQGAATAAATGREKFPKFIDLTAQEAFSWLAAGDAVQARKALELFHTEIKDQMGSANTWLKAVIALKQEEPEQAKQYLSIYLNRNLGPTESCDLQTLLYIWDMDGSLLESNPAYFFPNLPPRFTGLSATITRCQYGPSVLDQNANEEPPEVEVVQVSGVVTKTGLEEKKGEISVSEHYIDFDLHIAPDGHTTANSPEGQATADISIQVPNAIQLSLNLIEKRQTNAGLLKQVGQELYAWLFPGDIHTHLHQTEARSRLGKANIRLRMRIEAESIASLPLEFLYRMQGGYFLAINPNTVFSPYLNLPLPPERVRRREGPLHMLVIIADPTDQIRLDPDEWEIIINEALAEPLASVKMTLQTVKRATRKEIRNALLQGKPDIVQFVGHGIYQNGKGYLALVKEDTGTTWLVDDESFANLFMGHDDYLGLISLATCESAKSDNPQGFLGISPKLVQRGVPAVVAMQYEVFIKTAKIFLEDFYTAVAARKPIDWATQSARNAISQELGLDNREFATPVLFMRAQDGNVF